MITDVLVCFLKSKDGKHLRLGTLSHLSLFIYKSVPLIQVASVNLLIEQRESRSQL
jgi:hypothetical protein